MKGLLRGKVKAGDSYPVWRRSQFEVLIPANKLADGKGWAEKVRAKTFQKVRTFINFWTNPNFILKYQSLRKKTLAVLIFCRWNLIVHFTFIYHPPAPESVLLPSPALEVKLGSSEGELAISSELNLSGDAQGSDSQSSEEAGADLGRGPSSPSVGREYVQAFHITTKQVVLLECTSTLSYLFIMNHTNRLRDAPQSQIVFF